MRLLIIASAAAVLASAGSALADSQANTGASATQVSAPAEPVKNPVVCRQQTKMNTRTTQIIVCAKQSEWDRRTREDRERLERIEGVNLNPG